MCMHSSLNVNGKEIQTILASHFRFTGYSPLAKSQLLQDPEVTKIAQIHHKSPAQVLIRWSIQNDIVTIPKSSKKERVRENCDIWNFILRKEDMDALDGLHKDLHVTWDPSYVP